MAPTRKCARRPVISGILYVGMRLWNWPKMQKKLESRIVRLDLLLGESLPRQPDVPLATERLVVRIVHEE